jgi:hypothetical protein
VTPQSFEAARAELYGVAVEAFVAERTRLARELKTAGDKAGAARLAKLPRPVLSAWAVNQLWRHERAALDTLLAEATRLRAGDPGAVRAHREALAALRRRAAELLTAAGHDGSNEGTLRRVYIDLAALAARGGFDPGEEGALAADLEAPGFDVLGGAPGGDAGVVAPAPPSPRPGAASGGGLDGAPPVGGAKDSHEGRRRLEEAERQRREAHEAGVAAAAAAAAVAEAAAERLRVEAEVARLDDRMGAGLAELERCDRLVDALRTDMARAEAARLRAQEAVAALRSARAALQSEGAREGAGAGEGSGGEARPAGR